MVLIKTIFSALLTLSVATASPVFKRDANTVLSDLSTISANLDALTAAVTAYTGGLAGALTIANKESVLDASINKGTTDTNAAAAFTPDESTSIVNAVAVQLPKILSSLSALISKEPLFKASALDALVLSLVKTLKADTDKLSVALQTKAQPADSAVLVSGQVTIDAAFDAAIAAYS